MKPALSIIFPAYNEARTIRKAIKETAQILRHQAIAHELIVVDDGSTDDTLSIAQKLVTEYPELRIIQQSLNQGKGAAIQRGVAEANGQWMAFMDCDLATHPRELPLVLPLFDTTDIVIGSRRHPQSRITEHQPWYRQALGKSINAFIRYALKLPYHDTQCGFKLFRNGVAKILFRDLKTKGWVFDVEVLLKAQRLGYRITEVPVTWKNGDNTRVTIFDSFAILRDLYRLKKRFIDSKTF